MEAFEILYIASSTLKYNKYYTENQASPSEAYRYMTYCGSHHNIKYFKKLFQSDDF